MYTNILELLQIETGNVGILRSASEQPAVVFDRGSQDQHRDGHVSEDVQLVPFELFVALRPRDVGIRAGAGRLTNDPIFLLRG